MDNKQIDHNNIISTTVMLMKLCHKNKKLSGKQKKDMVTKILYNSVVMHDYEVKILSRIHNRNRNLKFIELYLPSIIDMIIELDHRKITINTPKSCVLN